MASLPSIPVVDVREGGAVRHARDGSARARALRDDCLAWFPGAVRACLPLLDGLTRRWLRRARSPYLGEIEAIAAELNLPGIWFLNGSYEWGCTTLAREEDGVPWLARTLDWPFPGLGRNVEVARMRGSAGEFWSVTWPGYVGALTVLAPGRFAAAMNQAPLWRRTRRPKLRLWDMAANAVSTWSLTHMPPDQLLRQVCETCATFADARARLETVPVARPVIFTLAGCVPGERCVIERTEEAYATRTDDTVAANDWLTPKPRWEARVGGDIVLTCSFDEATANSRSRREALAAWRGGFGADGFSWVTPPVLNPFTRVAAELCPARGTLRVVGYEQMDGTHAQPATSACEIGPALIAA